MLQTANGMTWVATIHEDISVQMRQMVSFVFILSKLRKRFEAKMNIFKISWICPTFTFLACSDFGLTDLSNEATMETNGWEIDMDKSSHATERYSETCNHRTFYGYKLNHRVGKVSATFKGFGNATLNFGNCYKAGYVAVSLNGHEIAKALANINKKEVQFEYSKGDILLIEEVNIAIVKLNSLTLSCNGGEYNMILYMAKYLQKLQCSKMIYMIHKEINVSQTNSC